MIVRHGVYLDRVTWHESLTRFSAWVAADPPPENALRLAHHLQNLAPAPFSAWNLCAIDDASYEKLLICGDLKSAAKMLLGPRLRHSVRSRARGYGVTVRVWCPGNAAVAVARDADIPRALVKAWAGYALARLEDDRSIAA